MDHDRSVTLVRADELAATVPYAYAALPTAGARLVLRGVLGSPGQLVEVEAVAALR